MRRALHHARDALQGRLIGHNHTFTRHDLPRNLGGRQGLISTTERNQHEPWQLLSSKQSPLSSDTEIAPCGNEAGVARTDRDPVVKVRPFSTMAS